MILKTHEDQDLLVAEVQLEEANLTQSDGFKEEMIALIDQGNHHILVDFRKVKYVDSSFLGALVSALKYAMAQEGDVAVVNLNKDIHDLFSLIRLDKVFKIFPDRKSAIIDSNK